MLRLPHIQPLAAIAMLALLPGPVRADEWQLLGSRRVSFRAERDVIPVTVTQGLFKSIKLEVEDGNLEMFDVRVVFGDGEVFSPETRFVFRENTRSRTIDLPGKARVIRRIEFAYRSTLRRGEATIKVYGKPAEGRKGGQGERPGAAAAAPAPNPFNQPAAPGPAVWDNLGTRVVTFRTDRDAVAAAGQGRFRAIRLVVEGAPLEMFNIKVVFGDGTSFSPTTRLLFKEGSWSREIDLPGDARIVRRVEFLYKSVAAARTGRATVTVFGRR